MQRFFFFFLLLLFVHNIQAQDLEFEENYILFQDTKKGTPVLILRDSILYKGNPLVKFKYQHTPYPDELRNYINYCIKGKTFLVHMGSGPVLEYRNDSIIACNKAPKFQNQHGGGVFVFNHELHFFGGYGLFTYKNIITRYDAKNKDWVQVQTFGDIVPSPRARFYSGLVNENFYVFGGEEDDPANFPKFKKCDNTLWRLHLPSMRWYKMGDYDHRFLLNENFSAFTGNDKLYLISTANLGIAYEIDFVKNTLKKFAPKAIIKPTQIYFDDTKKELFCISSITNVKHKFFRSNLNSFLGKPILESEFILPFYKKITPNSIGLGLGVLFLGLGILIFIKNKSKKSILPFNGIVYKRSSHHCYYKNKLIENLEEPELRILLYLIANANRFTTLNELNHLVDNGNNSENFSTLVKRREITLAALLQKMSVLTTFPEEEILINRKNPEDKRIKEIKIAPSFIKIK